MRRPLWWRYHPPMPLVGGATFAGYTILRLLGSGGMGEVYLAQHPRLPRRDALKILPQDVTADSEFRERFHREADLASTLWHPHIVSVHDRGEFHGQLWIALDYVEGADAGQLMKTRYPAGLPAADVCAIVAAVAAALDYAHKQGLLHRDVKPANIMLTYVDDEDDRRILLTDFGIARNLDDISGLTATNMAVGTVAYSAPEQLMGEEIGGRADQYALAATAYHLLTGSQIFAHSNPAVVISRHLNAPPPLLADSRPELADLDHAMAVALAKNPADRFPRCADFARALAQDSRASNGGLASLDGRTSPALAITRKPVARGAIVAPSGKIPPATGAGIRSQKRWLLPVIGLAIVLLVGITALAWRPWQHRQPAPTATSTSTAPAPTFAPSSMPTPPTAAAPPPTAAPAPTPTTPGPIIIARCWSPGSALRERPSDLEYGCDGTGDLENMTWTSWGVDGADGTGTTLIETCEPDCADSPRIPYPVVVHAQGTSLAPASCRATFSYYSSLVIAYPQQTPSYRTDSTYNGMPANQYADDPRC
jgi:serine/threonine-protein kinase